MPMLLSESPGSKVFVDSTCGVVIGQRQRSLLNLPNFEFDGLELNLEAFQILVISFGTAVKFASLKACRLPMPVTVYRYLRASDELTVCTSPCVACSNRGRVGSTFERLTMSIRGTRSSFPGT